MGQRLDTMTHHEQSKDELLYQWVVTANVDAIRALHLQGASLEWIDREGKTPLIVACMDSGLINVAETLIELGANINAYRPGRNGGTPLHHAAKRGLEPTVMLLLSQGANVLARNDECHTPLDVARMKGHTDVVRAIESHICCFSGWLREFYGPGFLDALPLQLLTRKIWVVVIPCGSGNHMKPPRFELAIYPTLQDARPRAVIALLKAKVDEPKFHQSDPALNIFDQSTKIRYKLASSNEGDKRQLEWLYNACRGNLQVMPSTQAARQAIGSTMANTHQTAEAINANGWENSTTADSLNGWGPAVEHTEAGCSGWMDGPSKEDYNGWGAPASGPTSKQSQGVQNHTTPGLSKEEYNGWGAPDSRPTGNQSQGVQTHTSPAPHVQAHANAALNVQTSNGISASASAVPSAPPLPEEVSEGPIHYPSVENSMVDLHVPVVESDSFETSNIKDEGTSSSCVICWEAPVEGACIPCGHMAGCMSCLNEIKTQKGVCPVCRTKINQVIRIYAV